MTMRIGIIRDTYFTNEPRGLNMAKILSNAGFEVFVLCYGDKDEVDTLHKIVIDRFHLNTGLKKKLSALIEVIPVYKLIWKRKICSFIEKYKIDVLQVHDLYMLGAAIKANKKYGLPLVANFHENYAAAVKTYNWTKSFLGKIILTVSQWDRLEKKYLKKVQYLILLSESFKKKLLRKYDFLQSSKIAVYPNVPDLKEFESYPIEETIFNKQNRFVIFYFGVIAERRGIFTTLEMLKNIKGSIPVILLLIGPVDKADEKRFAAYLNDEDIKECIVHYSWKDLKYLPSYLMKSDICISPILKNSQHDSGVANKIFQYMLYARPLLVSDSSEQKRIVEETACGLVHKSGDAMDMAEKVMTLYENPLLREQMGKNGKRAVVEKYNTAVQSKEIIRIYKGLEQYESRGRQNG